MDAPWPDIAEAISAATGERFTLEDRKPVSGGCINRAWIVSARSRRYFLKVNDAARRVMFEAEAAGLSALARTNCVRVPKTICAGEALGSAWLVLECIDLHPRHGPSDGRLGQQLAALHRHGAHAFGWEPDNTIGPSLQNNKWCADWATFWRSRRLEPQLTRAAGNGYRGKLQADAEKLLDRLGDFLTHSPQPALLHGDLWSGNAAADTQGTPVIFDPAVYYGDREADIAMTELFGGFSARFYSAYREAWPLDAGYEVRKDLYNLYHVLNHLNLFGASYLGQAKRVIARLLAEAR